MQTLIVQKQWFTKLSLYKQLFSFNAIKQSTRIQHVDIIIVFILQKLRKIMPKNNLTNNSRCSKLFSEIDKELKTQGDMMKPETKIVIAENAKPYDVDFDETITFGVEIECLVPYRYKFDRDGFAAKLSETAGINVFRAAYSSKNYSVWQLKSDASVQTRGQNMTGGFEVVSPVLKGTAGLNDLKKIMVAMNTIGCKVNKTCGLHVHYGFDSFFENPCFDEVAITNSLKNVLDTYIEYEYVIDNLVSNKRRGRGTKYCWSIKYLTNYKHFNEDSLAEVKEAMGTRYSKLNFCSLDKCRTIEVRQLQGTLDFNLISNWIFLNQKLIHRGLLGIKNPNRNARHTWNDLMAVLQLDGAVYDLGNSTVKMVNYLTKMVTKSLKKCGMTLESAF